MLQIDSFSPDTILSISPYNAMGYGFAVFVLIWVVLYFKKTLAEKEVVISQLVKHQKEAFETVSEKLTEIKNFQSIQQMDRQSVITSLEDIKRALKV